MSDQPTHASLKMYSTTWCGDCRRSRRWLDDNHIPYESIDIDRDESAALYVTIVNRGMRRVPTIVFPNGLILTEPSNAQLAMQVYRVLGIATPDGERALAQR